jgi:hypothetical protein
MIEIRCEWCDEIVEVDEEWFEYTGGPVFCNNKCVIFYHQCYEEEK